jgi:hypothetical protein
MSKGLNFLSLSVLIAMGLDFYHVQFLLFSPRDPWHKIPALDPEKLNVFRTVREITGEGEKRLPFVARIDESLAHIVVRK